jgi:hypothetical protein
VSIVRASHRAARRSAFERGLKAVLDYRLHGAPAPVCPHNRATRVGHAWHRGAAMADGFADKVEGVLA